MAKEFRALVHFQMFSMTYTSEINIFVHAHLFQGIMCIFFITLFELMKNIDTGTRI